MTASLVMRCDHHRCRATLTFNGRTPSSGIGREMSPTVARQYVFPEYGWVGGKNGDFCGVHADEAILPKKRS